MINPIIARHARVQFRLERTGPVVVAAVYLLILVLGFLMNYFMIGTRYSSLEESLHQYSYELLGVQLFVLVVVGAIRVAGSIAREREQKRFDFEVVTGMSPWRIAEGEMLGSALFAYFLILCTLPFMLICVLGGGIGWETFGYSYLLLFSAAFFFQSLALLFSSMSGSFASAVVAALVVVGALSAAPLLYHGSGSYRALSVVSPFYLVYARKGIASLAQFGFFRAYFSELFAIAVVYVFFGLWALNGAARKIRNVQGAYLSKLQAVVFTAVFCTVVAGLLAGRTHPAAGSVMEKTQFFFENTAIYLTAVLLMLLVLSFLLTPSGISYATSKHRGAKGVWHTWFGENAMFLPNLLILFAVSVIIYFTVFIKASPHVPHLTGVLEGKVPLTDILVGFFFVLIAIYLYSILVQLMTLFLRRLGRPIAALVVLMLIITPALVEIATGAPKAGYVRVLNPVAVIVSILPTAVKTQKSIPLVALVFYLVFCALLGLLLLLKVKLMHARLGIAAHSLQGQTGRK